MYTTFHCFVAFLLLLLELKKILEKFLGHNIWNTFLNFLKMTFPGKINFTGVRAQILGFRVLDLVNG
jgi:hypothetical protein